jgi:hypothetical protein
VKFSVLGETASRRFLFSLQALSLARKAGEMNNEFCYCCFGHYLFSRRGELKKQKRLYHSDGAASWLVS